MRKLMIMLLTVVLLFSISVSASAAHGLVYQDPRGAVHLTVPEGWDLEFEEDAYSRITFLPCENPSARMAYAATDYWSSLDAAARTKLKRSSLDNSHFSPKDVAELVGCTAQQVKRITLDGTEYYRVSFQKEIPSGKFAVLLEMTYFVRYHNGWIHVYQYVGSPSDPLFVQFKDMIRSAVYDSVAAESEPTADSQLQTYEQAITAYENGSYQEAQDLFQTVADYEDSPKYLRLLRIRNSGGNTWMDSNSYDKTLALTQEQKLDIDEAAADFSFADTAQVLLCNSDVATYYLTGLWSGGVRCYLHFEAAETGGQYRIGNKLSEVIYTSYAIKNGQFQVMSEGEEMLLLELSLTQHDQLEVISHAMDGQHYTLERK